MICYERILVHNIYIFNWFKWFLNFFYLKSNHIRILFRTPFVLNDEKTHIHTYTHLNTLFS